MVVVEKHVPVSNSHGVVAEFHFHRRKGYPWLLSEGERLPFDSVKLVLSLDPFSSVERSDFHGFLTNQPLLYYDIELFLSIFFNIITL